MEQQNTIKSRSIKLILIIVAVVFVLSAIAVPVVVTTTRNDATATTQSADSSIGNLYNTDGTLNRDNINKFLNKINASDLVTSKPTVTGPQIATRAGTSGSFVFEMGYYVSTSGAITTSKPIKWQAVYSRNGYLTIWMADNYTQKKYSNLTNEINTVYNTLQSKFSTLNSILKSPKIAGSSWQASQPSVPVTTTSYVCTNNGLSSTNLFWAPSAYEIYNTNTDVASQDTGLWGLNNTARAYNTTTIDGTSGNTWCWMRSGYSQGGTITYIVNNGSASTCSSSYTGGIRPACHIDLMKLIELCGWEMISASISNPDTNKATVDKTSAVYEPNSGTQLTFTFTGLSHYYFNSITINGSTATISNSIPSTFSNITGGQYKCYRSANKVIVIVTNLTQDMSIVGGYFKNGGIVKASITGGGDNKATVDKTQEDCINYLNMQSTFTFSTFGQYYIGEMRINGTLIEISDSVSGFSTISAGKYKCYRVNNKVIVTVTDLTADMNIVATCTEALVTISSFDPTLELKQDSMYTIIDSNGYRVKIVATFVQSERVKLCVDGAWANLTGKNGRGTMRIDGNEIEYAHFIYNNYITIEVSKLPIAQHLIYIDHYISGIGGNISTSLSGASASSYIDQYTGDNGENIILVNPASGEYVYEMQINGVAVPIEYYKAEVYGVGGAVTVNYVAPDASCTSNQFVLVVSNLFSEMNIVFKVQNSAPSLKNPPTASGTAIVGTTVTASVGGEARIVGNNIASGSNTDTITVIAVAYSDYNFVGWVYADDENEILSNSASAVFTKEQANGKIIKALFTPKATNENSPNGQTNNTNEIV